MNEALMSLNQLAVGIVVIACVAGIIFQNYRDNLLQRIGMWLVGMALVHRIFDVPVAHPMADTALNVGLAAFAVGTAIKVLKNARPKAPPPPAAGPSRLGQHEHGRIRGAGIGRR